MTFLLALVGILHLHPEWRPDACDRTPMGQHAHAACLRRAADGLWWSAEVAWAVAAEARRGRFVRAGRPEDVLWYVAQMQRESDIGMGDVCPVDIPLSWSPRSMPLDDVRVLACWTPPSAVESCQPVIVRATDARHWHVDRCAYGEIGLFQLRAHEARSGQLVPATGLPLPWGRAARRAALLVPRVNASLAFAAFAAVRDACCRDDDCDPPAWLGAYNTGRCHSGAGDRYVSRIDALRRQIVDRVCSWGWPLSSCTVPGSS